MTKSEQKKQDKAIIAALMANRGNRKIAARGLGIDISVIEERFKDKDFVHLYHRKLLEKLKF